MLVNIGLALDKNIGTPPQHHPTPKFNTLKLVGMPAFTLAVGAALGLNGVELYAALILAALPTAQNVYNNAATYEVWLKRT